MALKPAAAIARLQAANNNAYNANTNPNGLAQGGHRQNFVPDLQALVDVANWTGDTAVEVDGRASDAEVAQEAAENSASAAAGSASTASTKADEAATSATNAAASAARLLGTSTTSVTPSVASKTFTTQGGKAFDPGAWLMIQSAGSATRWMFGKVTSYNATTGALTVAVEAIGTTATAAADWTIMVSGGRGATGPIGVDSWAAPVDWAPSTAYTATAPRSTVVYAGETYVCTTSHTSGVTLDTTKFVKVAAKGADGPAPSAVLSYVLNLHLGS